MLRRSTGSQQLAENGWHQMADQFTYVYDGPIVTANAARRIQNRHQYASQVGAIKAYVGYTVRASLRDWETATGPVRVIVQDECPTARLRDIDAICNPTMKAIFDAFTEHNVWVDDKQIVQVTYRAPRKSADKKNRIRINVRTIPDGDHV
jgi:Holliday junction resolvase RusA-like endonuclease